LPLESEFLSMRKLFGISGATQWTGKKNQNTVYKWSAKKELRIWPWWSRKSI
jgi:hypothetical protein